MIELEEIKSLDRLMDWRIEVIEHVFDVNPDPSLIEANKNYYRRHIADGSHLAFVASEGGKEIGCGSICLTEELPSPDNPSGKCSYLMNIYVREEFRNQGVAHSIVRLLIEKSKEMDCGKIYLETTSEGRPVYESLGFRDMQDMMKLKMN